LPEALRTYDIRHSHASLLIDQGANVLAIAQRMGHTSPATTLRVYEHLFAGAQEDLTRRLDSLCQTGVRRRDGADVIELSRSRGAGPSGR
jgi:integrase